MMEVERYGKRSTAFDKIISATHDHFWDPLDTKYIDFAEPYDLTKEMVLPEEFFPIFKTRIGDTMTAGAEDQVRQRVHALAALGDPAWRAGRAGAVGLALPHPQGSGRAGIRRQPDARRGPSRHRLLRLCEGALGHAAALRRDAAEPAHRNGSGAGGLQEDRRHADAGRGSGHGRLRDALPEVQGSAAGQAVPAGHDRRSLPPQIRKDLGRPHDPEADGRRAQQGRGLGGAVLPDAAVQSHQSAADGAGLQVGRHRSAGCDGRDPGSLRRRTNAASR